MPDTQERIWQLFDVDRTEEGCNVGKDVWCNRGYYYGIGNGKGYDSSRFRTNDALCLTFDCEKQKIELHLERENKI